MAVRRPGGRWPGPPVLLGNHNRKLEEELRAKTKTFQVHEPLLGSGTGCSFDGLDTALACHHASHATKSKIGWRSSSMNPRRSAVSRQVSRRLLLQTSAAQSIILSKVGNSLAKIASVIIIEHRCALQNGF